MYKLISIDEADMTRHIELENLATGTIDTCFDDSALVSDDNFEFMKTGNTYDCKIILFGELVNEKDEDTVECTLINKNVLIGNRLFLQVLVKKNVYYIYQKDNDLSYQNEFLFWVGRKNIAQVNSVIHDDLL